MFLAGLQLIILRTTRPLWQCRGNIRIIEMCIPQIQHDDHVFSTKCAIVQLWWDDPNSAKQNRLADETFETQMLPKANANIRPKWHWASVTAQYCTAVIVIIYKVVSIKLNCWDRNKQKKTIISMPTLIETSYMSNRSWQHMYLQLINFTYTH